jgi:cyanophycinase-like exopeptidase
METALKSIDKMKKAILMIAVLGGLSVQAQNYTSYFTGDESDVNPETLGGLVLMGGATENDQAMQWFLEKANGGDVVVIRTSGSDGYNNYLYNQLGVTVNSVESIVLNNAAAANDPYVITQIENAEALWIAGGNQWTYVNEWKDQGVGNAINYLLNEKGAVVGGTSAGMAVLGGTYFSAQNGSIQSATALSNPFHNSITLGHGDFLHAPYMENVVTDQHYNNPDRRGRHVTFMARMEFDLEEHAFGIASDEYTAVCVEPDGTARAFGDYPEYDDFVYFLQSNCVHNGPEVIEPGTPLTWNRDNQAIQVYKVPATNAGQNVFDLNDWETGSGGSWQYWWVEEGNLMTNESGEVPNCVVSVVETNILAAKLFPTITTGSVEVWVDEPSWQWQLYDLNGRMIYSGNEMNTMARIDLSGYHSGMYVLELHANGKQSRHKIIRR